MSMHVVPSQTRCGDDPRQLHRDHAQHRAPLGDVDAEQSFGAERERDVVADRVEIVLAIGPGNDLVVLAILADLLESAVQVADVRNAAHHGLAVQFQDQAQHAVRRRVLRSDVDQHVIAIEVGLERQGRRDRTSLGIEPAGRQRDLDGPRAGHAILPSTRRGADAAASPAAGPRTRRRSTTHPWSTAPRDWRPMPGATARRG